MDDDLKAEKSHSSSSRHSDSSDTEKIRYLQKDTDNESQTHSLKRKRSRRNSLTRTGTRNSLTESQTGLGPARTEGTYRDDDLEESVFDTYELREQRTRESMRNYTDAEREAMRIEQLEFELENKYPNLCVTLDQEELPLNWSVRKKAGHTIAYGTTTFATQFCASLISPSNESLQKEFHIGREVATLIFSIYILGQTVGPMIFAPLSEVKGRKIGVFVACFVAGFWTCMCACASSAWSLMVFRFISGVFSAAPIVSSGGALGDLWRPKQRATALVLYSMCIIIGSAAAPVIGALLDITGSYGWRWGCWLTGLIQMVLPVVYMIFVDETYGPVLAKKKAALMRFTTGVWGLHADLDLYTLSFEEFIKIHCMRPVLMFATPIIFVLVLYCSFVYGLLFLSISTVGFEFQRYHHFSKVASYCPLLSIFPGFLLGSSVNLINSRRYARLLDKAVAECEASGGEKPPTVAPEERLPATMMAGWFVPCGLFMYGWCMDEHIHWIVPTIGIALIGGGISIVFQGCLVYMVDVYTKYSASAIAANTLMRSVFGGVFPLFSYQMFNKMGIHWAASVLGFVGLALWPMSWVFYLTGAKIRRYNPYDKLLL